MGNTALCASAADETTFPEEKPTSNLAANENGYYTAPVYIYTSDYESESMSNRAIEHTAYLKILDGKKYVTLNFHPMEVFDTRGHIQNFYYYNMSAETYTENRVSGNGAFNTDYCKEVTGDDVTWGYDSAVDLTEDETAFAKYVASVTFELPTDESDVVCRFSVDAMSVDQDAILVFDWANTVSEVTSFTEQKIASAKEISNDDGTYTEKSYSTLQTAISNAETGLSSAKKYSPAAQVTNMRQIDYAIAKLVTIQNILPNGTYEVPFAFYCTEDSYEEYSDLAKRTEKVTADKMAYLNNLFGDTASVTAVDGSYTVTLTAQNDGTGYYLAFLNKTSYGASGIKFTMNTQTVNYFGTDKKLIAKDSTVTVTLNNVYKAEDMIIKVQGWNSVEKANSITVIDPAVAFSLDWNNAVKTADLDVNKTDLSDYVGYVNSRLSGDMSAYTESSVSALQTAYEAAKVVNEDTNASQATVDNALATLKSATSALEQKVSLAGYTAELADYVGLNYYLNISDEIKAQNPTVKFTFGDAEPQLVPLADATFYEGRGYKFTAKLDPKNMTDTVTAEVYIGEEKVPTTAATTKKLSTSIQAYADTVITNADSAYTDEAIAAAKAMLNYGGYSQVLFGYSTDKLANASIDKDVSSVTAETLAGYKPTKEGSDDTAKFTGYNLYLDSLTSMRFWYTGDVTASANAENFTTGESGGKKYVEISGITPANLVNGYDITVGGMTIHASPASYAHTALTKSDNTALQNAMKAMILYSNAAAAYAATIQ